MDEPQKCDDMNSPSASVPGYLLSLQQDNFDQEADTLREDDAIFVGYGEENFGRSPCSVRERVSNLQTEFYDTVLHAFCMDEACIFSEDRMFEILFLVQGKGNEAEIQQKFFSLSQDNCKSLVSEDTLKVATSQLMGPLGRLFSLKRSLKVPFHKKCCPIPRIQKPPSSDDLDDILIVRNNSLVSVSSLGILDASNLSGMTCESFEGVGGEVSRRDTGDLVNEIEELQFQNCKLNDEVSRFKAQALQTDEIYQQVVQESEDMRRKISNLLVCLDKMRDLQDTNEDLKSSLQALEQSKAHVQVELERLRKEKLALEADYLMLQDKLNFSSSEVDISKQRELELLVSLSNERAHIEDLNKQIEELESLLHEKSMKCTELELAVKELAEANEALRHDKSVMDIQLAKAQDDINSLLEFFKINTEKYKKFCEGCGDSPLKGRMNFSQLFGLEEKGISEDEMIIPNASFGYQQFLMYGLSLCTEISNSVSLREDLPSPFCGKFSLPIAHKPERPLRFSLHSEKERELERKALHACHSISDKTSSFTSFQDSERASCERQDNIVNEQNGVKPAAFKDLGSFILPRVNSPESESLHHFQSKVQHKKEETCTPALEVQFLKSYLTTLSYKLKNEWKLLKRINDESKFPENTEIDDVKQEQTPCAEEVVKCSDLQESREANITPDIWEHVETNSAENNLVMGLSTNDVREQMNIEIRALRAQIIRSHALLSYLTKEKETPSAIQKSSLEISNQQILPLEEKPGMGFFQQRSLDGQVTSHKSLSHRCCMSHRSHKSTPLHKQWLSNSCPFLLSEISAMSRSTQTELVSISESPRRNHKSLASTSSGNGYYSYPQCTTNSAIKNSANKEAPILTSSPNRTTSAQTANSSDKELHNFNGSELPISPIFARNRTYSFLTAVFKGNPNLVDASQNSSYQNNNHGHSHSFEEQSSQIPEWNKHPYFGSLSEIRKDHAKIYNPKQDTSYEKEKCVMSSKTEESGTVQESSKQRTAESVIKDVNFKENISSSEESKLKADKPSDKSFKTPQRSMRRGSGTGSPNSLSSIPRYPAFDFSEQDEEQSFAPSVSTPKPEKSANPQTIQITDSSKEIDFSLPSPSGVKEVRHKKSETGKSMTLMPDLMENSETESAKGSFECEAPEMPLAEVPTIAVSEVSFPNLPDSFLHKLGVHKDSTSIPEMFTEQELETKYNTLSLAFKTDKLTLSKRLELQKRQRDNAEKNVENEIKVLKDSLSTLNLNCTSSEVRDLISKIQNHVDIIQQSTSRMSGRSEIYGAVQQEERVSKAFEVLVLHVDNLKRVLDKERRDLEEARRILSGTKEVSIGDAAGDDNKRSLRAVSLAVGSLRSQTIRRRASVAVFHSSPDGLKPKPRSLSNSWTAGFHNIIKMDTRGHQPNVLHPFSLTSSIGLSSNSSSASLLAPLPSPSCRTNAAMSRRCSLPSDAGENVPKALELLREKSVFKGLNQDQNQGDQYLNISRKLYSVSDEEEEEQEDQCFEEKNEADGLNDVLVPPSPVIPPMTDFSPDFSESEFSVQEKYDPQGTFHYRTETSGLLLLRYSFSGLLVVMALLCLFVTFLPCLAVLGDTRSFQEVLETVFQRYVVVKHIDRPV